MAQPFLALITPVGSTGPVDPGWSGGVAPPGGQPPLGIWGPPQMPPGIWPSPPGSHPPSGAHPSHPIYNPAYPDNTLPQPPLGIWGGGNVPYPTPPIYIPAQPVLPDAGDPTKAHLVVYVPGQGAISFTIDISTLPPPVEPTEPAPK